MTELEGAWSPADLLALWQRELERLEGLAARKLGRRGEDVEDVVSETFTRALEALPRNIPSPSWLNTILINVVIDLQRRETPLSLEELGEREDSDGEVRVDTGVLPGRPLHGDPLAGDVLDEVIADETSTYRNGRLAVAMKRLRGWNAQYARILVAQANGAKLKEIAEAEGLEPKLAKSRADRARQLMRKYLMEETA